MSLISSSSSSSSSSKKTSPGKMRLLGFLRRLLEDPTNSDIIIWTNEAKGEFQLVKPHAVAAKWGSVTGNPSMTYDKMSRGLRFLYTSKTLVKIPGKDSRYCFVTPTADTSIVDISDFSFNLPDLGTSSSVPDFSINRLLNITNISGSLQSSPTSTSTTASSSERSSTVPPTSPSSPDDVRQPGFDVIVNQIIPFLMEQFEQFKVNCPAVQALPMPLQMSLFQLTHPLLGGQLQ